MQNLQSDSKKFLLFYKVLLLDDFYKKKEFSTILSLW